MIEWMGYFSAWYLGDIAGLPLLAESYFRNNADLGTGLLIGELCHHQPPFFCLVSILIHPPDFSQLPLKFLHPSYWPIPNLGSGF